MGQPTDMCQTLQEEQANIVDYFLGQSPMYDPYTNTYNLGWRDHPKCSYENNNQTCAPYNLHGFPNPRSQQQQQPSKPQPPQQPQGKTMEDLMNTLVNNTTKFMHET